MDGLCLHADSERIHAPLVWGHKGGGQGVQGRCVQCVCMRVQNTRDVKLFISKGKMGTKESTKTNRITRHVDPSRKKVPIWSGRSPFPPANRSQQAKAV